MEEIFKKLALIPVEIREEQIPSAGSNALADMPIHFSVFVLPMQTPPSVKLSRK
jgi:hypothetical protein